jgi:hypothetical protein
MIRAALTRIARRIIREETFESLVAPALADLHFEAASGRPLGRHYAGLSVVFAIALLRDLRIDVRLTFESNGIWRRAAAWHAGFVVLFISLYARYTPWHLLDGSGRAAVLAAALSDGLTAALPMTMVAVAFYLRRRSAVPYRTITIATMACVVAAVVIQLGAAAVRPAVNRVLLDSATRVISHGHPGAGLDDRNQYPGQWRTWLDTVRERSSGSQLLSAGYGNAAAAMATGYVVYLIPFALWGVVLARGRGWTVLLRVVGLVITYFAVAIIAMQITIGLYGPSSPDYQAARQIAATFFTAGVWLLGVRVLFLPLVPIYALTRVRKWVPRSSSLPD